MTFLAVEQRRKEYIHAHLAMIHQHLLAICEVVANRASKKGAESEFTYNTQHSKEREINGTLILKVRICPLELFLPV
uniref:Uncharacterized protein n=1 Tax=Trichuris muris TaxID=70415 RepID=A0A5S6Q6Q9_TRIMR